MATAILLASSAWAASEKKLHNFGLSTYDGSGPYYGSLVFDANGNLYGTTYTGGRNFVGTAFELSPNGSGGWTERVIHNFGADGTDGTHPYAGLVVDAAGNLYGTTNTGGDYNGGTVFELMPDGSGGWTEKKLHNFNSAVKDGVHPDAGLIFDAVGNLYGTTYDGGDQGVGTVFEMSPNGSGAWTETKLHNFRNNGKDGTNPQGGVVFDSAGNLYGTTYLGGDHQVGTVYELSPGSGGWTEKKLHNFSYNHSDGIYPSSSLVLDAAGDLYGTTYEGGDYPCNFGCGTVFEMTPNGDGTWTEKKLHNFGLTDTDGTLPYAGLTFDNAGNLFGATTGGGDFACPYIGCGTVFELSPQGGGGWTEKKLWNFSYSENFVDGAYPYGGVIFDAAGNLYGATMDGGNYNSGTVFEIKP